MRIDYRWRGILWLFFAPATSLVGGELSTDDLKKWVCDWADSTAITSLSADFQSEKKSGERTVGTWHFRTRPAFAQRLSIKDYREDRLVSVREISWDLGRGLGKNLTLKGGSVRGHGTITPKQQSLLGRMFLPSNPSFLFVDSRPLAEYLRLVDLEVVALDDEGRRLAVFLQHPEERDVILRVYLFDRATKQGVTEQRVYFSNNVEIPQRASPVRLDLASSIELPGRFRNGAVLLIVKRVTGTATIKGKEIPIAWHVQHGVTSPDEDCTITIDPQSISLDEAQSDSLWDVSFPVGTRVYDSIAGTTSYVASDGRHVRTEVITEAQLDQIVSMGGFEHAASESAVSREHGARPASDPGTVTACSANALYMVLRMMGRSVSLSSLAADLGIREDNQACSFQTLLRTAQGQGVDCLPVEGNRDLLRTPKAAPVLLHVNVDRASQGRAAPHFLVVDDFDDETSTVRVFDPPKHPFRANLEDIARVWTGKALVFHPQSIEGIRRDAVHAASLIRWSVVVSIAAVVAILAATVVRRGGRRTASVMVYASLIALFGCERSRRETAVGFACLQTVGSDNVDLGEVEWKGQTIGHTFTIRNTGKRYARIARIQKSCACLEVVSTEANIAPGAETTVVVNLDARSVYGRRRSNVMLVFEPEGVQPLRLSVSADVVRDYKVHVLPMAWILTGDLHEARRRKRFKIREFFSTDDGISAAATDIESRCNELRVVWVGDTEAIGRSAHGHGREFEVELELDTSELRHPFEISCGLSLRPKARCNGMEFPLRVRG